jgi:hypothetical protein
MNIGKIYNKKEKKKNGFDLILNEPREKCWERKIKFPVRRLKSYSKSEHLLICTFCRWHEKGLCLIFILFSCHLWWSPQTSKYLMENRFQIFSYIRCVILLNRHFHYNFWCWIHLLGTTVNVLLYMLYSDIKLWNIYRQ